MTKPDAHAHERRYAAPAEKLRAPARIEMLEIPRVMNLSVEGIRDARVLDVGTGTGVFAEAFAEGGLDVTGIDANADLLASARAHAPRAKFVHGAAERLPFDDASFDLVFFGHVLHETDDQAAALREARRVARLRVALLEWPYVEEDRGPPLAHRLRSEDIFSLARGAGFTAVDRVTLSHMDLYLLSP